MNLTRVLANLVIEIKEFYRNKGTMFFVLAFPIILMLLFGFIFQGQSDLSYDLLVQDLDGGEQAANLTTLLGFANLFTIEMVDSTEDDLNQYLFDKKANTMLIIPEGFSADLDLILDSRQIGQPLNETVNLTVLYDPTNTAAMSKLNILFSIVDGINKGASGVPDVILIDIDTTVSDEFNAIDFFAPGIIAMSVMTTAIFGTIGTNTELRQKGVLRKLATTPLTRSEWLMANILYQLVMAAFSTTAILVVGIAVFGLQPHLSIYLIVFIVLNVVAFSGIGMLITRFVKEAESAQAAANAVSFPMMFLSGTFFPLETMPDFLQILAKFLPLYYINEGTRAAMITLDNGTVYSSALVMIVFSVIVFLLGIYLTSWKED